MSMTLDPLTSIFLENFTRLLKDEAVKVLGVNKELKRMKKRFLHLKDLINKAENKIITDELTRGWLVRAKRAMYQMADIFDLCRLKADEEASERKSRDSASHISVMKYPFFARDITKKITCVIEQLDGMKADNLEYQLTERIEKCEDRRTARTKVDTERRKKVPTIDLLGMVVGKQLQEDTRKLVQKLTEGSAPTEGAGGISVFAIVGLDGIGKTTLASMVYNDEAIERNFNIKVWLSITKEFNDVDLLTQAIICASGEHPAAQNKTVLDGKLRKAVEGKRCFVVLDDMCDAQEWDEFLRIPFSHSAPGSRVLVTTASTPVAKRMQALEPYHRVRQLDEEDGWLLLKKQVISSEMDQTDIDKLKDIGLKFVTECRGFPLGIKAIGKVLCQKELNPRKWTETYETPIWSESKLPAELNYAMCVSYGDLPPISQHCFLHYSLLPKRMEFSVHAIVSMWISEGVIVGEPDKLENLGQDCYDDLISRNLIEPDAQYLCQDVCYMHNVVRQFAQYVARDEALAAHSGQKNLTDEISSKQFIRLSIEGGSKAGEFSGKKEAGEFSGKKEAGGLEWSKLQTQEYVRTLILSGRFNAIPSNGLSKGFPSLRALHMQSTNVTELVHCLHQFHHLRYLCMENTDISELPEEIGMLKFLIHISLYGSVNLVKLPDNIVKLKQLRYLGLNNTPAVLHIPRGFCGLTNMKILYGFPAHVYDNCNWCSLEELGPLFQLRILGVNGLENVYDSSSAAKAKLAEKKDLTTLFLQCHRASGEKQAQIEEVFEKLCPPACLENLVIKGYFGIRLPSWMMSKTAMVALQSLRTLSIKFLSYCTQLPDGLGQLPNLEFLLVYEAEGIMLVGPEFQKGQNDSKVEVGFPKMKKLVLEKLPKWKKWEWEEEAQAMPGLEELQLADCGLSCVPPGLITQAKTLKVLHIHNTKINCLKNFTSVVELTVSNNDNLETITDFPNLEKLTIKVCLKMKALEGVPALKKLVLDDKSMKTLPEYIRHVKASHLLLFCDLVVLTAIAARATDPEWDKDVEVFKAYAQAYAHNPNNEAVEHKEWYVLYTKDPYKWDTNITNALIPGTLSACFEFADTQKFESVYKMTRETFNYICSLVKRWSLQDIVVSRGHTFYERDYLSLDDRVAVALMTMLNPKEPIAGLNESTISEVTWLFVLAIKYGTSSRCGASRNHGHWPDSNELEKIKSKFYSDHSLRNCCGVVDTTPMEVFLPSSQRNCDDDNMVLQAVVDSDMRFMDISVAWSGSDSKNNWSILEGCDLFKMYQKDSALYGNKKKVKDKSEVEYYIIGDTKYPLLPWLLTPYQCYPKVLSPTEHEFNRRHSSARNVAQKALAKFKDTWKILDGLVMDNPGQLCMMIHVCCVLHNIVIDMELSAVEKTHIPSDHEQNNVADEDPARERILPFRPSDSGDTEEQDLDVKKVVFARNVGFRRPPLREEQDLHGSTRTLWRRNPPTHDPSLVLVEEDAVRMHGSSSSRGDAKGKYPHGKTKQLTRSPCFQEREPDEGGVKARDKVSENMTFPAILKDAKKGDARSGTPVITSTTRSAKPTFTVPSRAALWRIPQRLLHSTSTCRLSNRDHPEKSCPFWMLTLDDAGDTKIGM